MNDIILSNLLNLVMSYTKKLEIIDMTLIYKIIDLISDNLGLRELIKDIIVDEDLAKNRISSYNCKTKELYINYKKILKYCVDTIQHRKLYDNLEEKIMEINLAILKIVLHELEHVNQIKKLNEQNCTLENALLKISCEPFINSNENLSIQENAYLYDLKKYLMTSRGYCVDPAERFAFIKASDVVNSLTDKLDSRSPVKIYSERDLNRELLSGYMELDDYVISPTNEFLSEQTKILADNHLQRDYLELYDLMEQDYSLKRRLYYGLSITVKEYNKYQK